MAKPVLKIQRHNLDWLLGKPLDSNELIARYGISAIDNGKDITNKVTFNATQVDLEHQGEYPIAVTVMNSEGETESARIMINIKSREELDQIPGGSQQTNPPRKRYRAWIVAIAVVIALVIIWWALAAIHDHNADQQVNNAEQSSQISNNSSSINKLSSDNQKLAEQVAALRGAARQYERDHNQQELQNQLNNIANQNQRIEGQLSSNSAKQKLNDVDQVINQLQQDPSNASSTVNALKNKDGFGEIWNSITSLMQSWVNDHTGNNSSSNANQ
ncbi:hypothetical protein [Limosilactobacillus fastidiosus]|uniref:DUF5011 domain-containing protein n=1 Tax=Limosilactobacillus fastidiosus TaxID=2759855 RepID=A0ABR6E5J2_9LACO|nr:hypothetical protein [Limosilactobacillus fastidiosus]MBB1062453.1 hypothetical protein [Limosilactobacillus fastidiosus]MCD7083527.1 DUF5011 domain-containing protein [Limosilactobacillus fastidiosus]